MAKMSPESKKAIKSARGLAVKAAQEDLEKAGKSGDLDKIRKAEVDLREAEKAARRKI